MKRFVLLFPLIVSALFCQAAYAEWKTEAAIGLRQVRIIETDRNGHQLVEEHGLLPGIELRTGYVTKQWRIEIAGEAYASRIEYDGQTQSGAAFSTDTKTRQMRIGAEAGHHITAETLAIAGVEHDYWRRHILGRRPVLGLEEQYRSWRLLVGAETRVLPSDRINARLKGLLVVSSPEKLEVRFGNRVVDDVRLKTKSAIGVKLALDTRLPHYPNIGMEANFEWMRIDRSEDELLRIRGEPVGFVAQPEHVRKAFGVKFKYLF